MDVIRQFLVLEARKWIDDFIRSWREIHATGGKLADVAKEFGITPEAAAARATKLRKMSNDASLELSKQQRADYKLPKFARGPSVETGMRDDPQLELMPAAMTRQAPELIDIIRTLNAASGYTDAAKKLGMNPSTLRGIASDLRDKGYPVKTFKRGRPPVVAGSVTKRKFIELWNSAGSPQLAAELLNSEGGSFTAQSASAFATKLREKGFDLQSFTHLRGRKRAGERPTPDDVLRDLEAEMMIDDGPDELDDGADIDDEAQDEDEDDDTEREARKAMFGDLDDELDDDSPDEDGPDDLDDELDDDFDELDDDDLE